MEDQYRCAAFQGADLNVLPTNPAAPSSLKCFQRGFFCGEARGIMLGRCGPAAFAIRTLCGGENTFSQARCTLERFAYARYFDNVYPNGNDHK